MSVMKKCCGLCPYSRKNTLFLHPDRAEQFAYQAENPYNDFVCHKTGITIEDHPVEELNGDIVRGEKSLTCAGFYAMQYMINFGYEGAEIELDYEDHFDDAWEMTAHHEENWNHGN